MRWLACALLPLLTAWQDADDPTVAASTPALQVQAGRGSFLALKLSRKAPRDLEIAASSSKPDVVDVPAKIAFLSGHDLAFLALAPKAEGTAEVAVGDARCAVTVRGTIAVASVDIVSPAEGAVLWGTVALRAAVDRTRVRGVEWLLDGAKFADGENPSLEAAGKPGLHRLEVRGSDASGRVSSAVRRVIFADPNAPAPVRHEAESLDKAVAAAGIMPAAIWKMDWESASGGKVAGLLSGDQLVQFTLDVPADGYYQAIVTGGCDRYLDFAAVTVIVDDTLLPPPAYGPLTSVRKMARHAIGAPFKLAVGKRRISFFFYNDAYEPATRQDRNCFIDAIELRPLGPARPDVAPPECVLVTSAPGGEVGGALVAWVAAVDDSRSVDSVELRVDGAVVASSKGDDLIVQIPADALAAGDHVLEGAAIDAAGLRGVSAKTTLRRLPYDGRAPESHLAMAAQGRVTNAQPVTDLSAPGLKTWALYSSGVKVVFPLDVHREADYDVGLYARADHFDGPPVARVSAGGRDVEIPVHSGRYGLARGGPLHLGPGRHELTVEFINDHYDPATGRDRNLFLAGLALWEKAGERDAPRAEVAYPAAGAELSGPEMVVARVSDNSQVAFAELLVDGEVVSRAAGEGRVGLWMVGRGLAAGRHTLQVRAQDRHGNAGLSAVREFRWTPPAADAPLTPTERGVHLLSRLGLGANAVDLADLLLAGEAAWLERELGGEPVADDFADILEREWNRDNFFDNGRFRQSVIAHALHTRRPVRERLAHFFDNHFSTWIGKTDLHREWQEHREFRRMALARFRDMLEMSASSPAMLAYLDNAVSRRGAINENYGREILELHTMGVHGGYTLADVQEVSRILTGWTMTLGYPGWKSAFDRRNHDTGEKTALGTKFGAGRDGEDAAQLLAILPAHPSTARFVSRKLAMMLVADEPPEAVVEAAAKEFLATGGDVPATVRAIVGSPAFFDRRNFGTKVRDPFELVVGTARRRFAGFDVGPLDHAMNRMGQGLFECALPTGYPERGGEWLNSNTLAARWNFAEFAAWSVALPGAEHPLPAERLVDDLSMSLIGRPLGEKSRAAVLKSFESSKDARAMAALILQMPEAQRN